MMTKKVDALCVSTIRTLAMDAVQRANSGHRGTRMPLAPVVYCLWQRFLRFDPSHPKWPNRGRFVLSAGHASMLPYAMLHLTGVRAVNPKYEALGELSVTSAPRWNLNPVTSATQALRKGRLGASRLR